MNSPVVAPLFGTPSAPSPEPDPAYIVVTPAKLPSYGIYYSRTHLRRLIAARAFPKPLQLSAHRIGWRLIDIRAWIDSRSRASP